MMSGVATVTIVMSTRIMKKPMQRAKSAGQGLVPSPSTVAVGLVEVPGPGGVVVTKTVNTLALTNHSPERACPRTAVPRHRVGRARTRVRTGRESGVIRARTGSSLSGKRGRAAGRDRVGQEG